jgi:hypothetical protein
MKFKKGTSGNPAGKPRGAKDKRTALRALLEPHAEVLVKKAVALALSGDVSALRICIDRIIAPVKARDMPVHMEALTGSLTEQAQKVTCALTGGTLTPDEASSVMQTLIAQARILEIDDLDRRLKALEARDAKT